MMHDFSLTEHYVVFYDLPGTFDPKQAVATTMPRLLRGVAERMVESLIGRVRLPEPIGVALCTRGLAHPVFPYRRDPRYPARACAAWISAVVVSARNRGLRLPALSLGSRRLGRRLART
ncbi:MAG TPA: hypothetical protein VG963_17110 [Polyangiaceae bacterium]|nr:hypothetical protein [Polyangiaceae bacterium]